MAGCNPNWCLAPLRLCCHYRRIPDALRDQMARAISALAPPLVQTNKRVCGKQDATNGLRGVLRVLVTYASITFGTARTAPRTDGNEPREFSATLAARRDSKASRLSTLFPNTPSETLFIASHPGMD